MFVFADASGHGLPAYTTLVKLRSSIILAVKEAEKLYASCGTVNTAALVNNISVKFTDIMNESNSSDFVCVVFTFISKMGERYLLKVYNRSMFFPMVLKLSSEGASVVNLNYPSEGWRAERGYYLGSEMYKLVGEQRYFSVPECVYTINKGDSVFFYSDGISEAYSLNGLEEFGVGRIESVLNDYAGLFPQIIVDELLRNVYSFIGSTDGQTDDMTAVLITFPTDDVK
jgi:hypothetical protein